MTDIRSIRTREKLRNSLENLLKNEEYEKISISDITDDAKINRVTFYTHYQDKDELLKDLIDNFSNKFAQHVDRVLDGHKDDSIPKEEAFLTFVMPFIDYCFQKRDFVKNMSKAKDGMVLAYFGKAISKAIYPVAQNHAKRKIKHAYSFSSSFVVAGYIDVILSWINNPVLSKEEFYNEIKDFTYKLLKSDLMYIYD